MLFTLPTGQKISYELTFQSEPTRPTILLAGSLAAQYSFWDAVVAALHERGFRILRFDHPGHGESTVPPQPEATTFESMAADVYALLTSHDVTQWFQGHHAPAPGALTPLLHAWVGVSMGAALGVVFAVRHPGVVRNLVVCDTVTSSPAHAGAPDAFTPRVAAARAAGNMDEQVEGSLGRWFAPEWAAAHAEEVGRLRGLMRQTTVEGFAACCGALTSDSFDLRPLAGQLATSVEHVLLVVGEKDQPLPEVMGKYRDAVEDGFKKVGKVSEQVELRVIPNAGHVSFVDGYDEWLKAVLPFL